MTVSAYALDHIERIFFFRRNKAGVPVQLPFDLVTLDGVQYYEPHGFCTVAPNGKRQLGAVSGCTYLQRNQPLPRPPAGQSADTFAVWFYAGV